MEKEIYHALSDPEYQDVYVDVEEATLPENAGQITKIAFDFPDRWGFPERIKGLFPVQGSVIPTEKKNGIKGEIFTQIRNLDRVRVIVE
ncbi:MAG: hypothetical protein IJ744_03595 [Lachnospiraceae bacterium]|nr:hypothetical protein [Lachnospiraceae bacterium]